MALGHLGSAAAVFAERWLLMWEEDLVSFFSVAFAEDGQFLR